MYDILIKNGQIIDGSGEAAFYGDIAVKDGKIAKIAESINEEAAEVIDAKGLQVSPGFIDDHTHSDESAFWGNDSWPYLEQGVTLQIAGHCGDSPAPYSSFKWDRMKGILSPEKFEIWEKAAKSPASFMKAAEEATYGTNMAFFVGHGALREKASGFTAAPPTPEQMAEMKADLKEALEVGYLGFSSGLVYTPSVYADTEELIELAKELRPYGGMYTSHIRGEGDNVLRSVAEAIRIGEEAGVPVMISHLKVMGKHNEGKSAEMLRMMEEANSRGAEIYGDQYPYTAGSAPISDQIPPRFLVGGIPALMKRLEDPEQRLEMDHAIFHEVDTFESAIYSAGYDGILVVDAEKTPQYVNKTLGQIAKEEGKHPIDVLAEVLIPNQCRVQGVFFNQCASDMMRIMAHPRVFSCSDWQDEYCERRQPDFPGGSHPRGIASAVRRLELVRDFSLRTMEESIKNMTYDNAQAVGIQGYGLLKEGWDANICVFDYANLHAEASYSYPYRKNRGIHYVVVNGAVAVRDGAATGVRNGKVLKRDRK